MSGSYRHPILEGMRENARAQYSKAAVRWHCNDYPYAALVSMIDARARALQLKGIRAGETIAMTAARSIGTVVDVAALWSIRSVPLLLPASHGNGLPGEAAIRVRVAGLLSSDGEYTPTGFIGKIQPAHQGSSALVLSPSGRDAGTCLTTRTALQLAKLSQQAQTAFAVADRTVLGLSPLNEPASTFEIWAVLANGGTVDLADDGAANDVALLIEHLRESTADLVYLGLPTVRMLTASLGAHALAAGVRDVILPALRSVDSALVAQIFPCARMHPDNATTDSKRSPSAVTCA